MKVIGIDLDDCLADFITEFTRISNKRFGTPEVGTQPRDWEWSNFGLTLEMQEEVWQEIRGIKNFWMTLGVEPGVDWELLQELEQKHIVYYPTARVTTLGYHAGQQSAAWIARKFGIHFPTVIAGYNKGPLAAALNYEYFLDDRPKNCLDILVARPECKVYLKDSSHNQDFVQEGVTRVKDFNEFAKIILEEK